MNRKYIICVLILAFTLAGCMPTSIHPLYFEKDLIFDPELIGTWGNPNDAEGDRLVFMKGTGSSYLLDYYESREDTGRPSKTAGFEAHLIKLGSNLFLDIYPREREYPNEFYGIHFLKTHSFARVEIVEDTLKLGLLDFSWLENNLDSGTVQLKHEYVEGQILLTASTEELQKFATQYADVAFPFSKDYEFERLF